MNLNKIPDQSDFIYNSDFLEWVLNPTEESEHYWKAFLADHPDRKKEMDQARFLINRLNPKEKGLNEIEIDLLWNRIRQSEISTRRKSLHIIRWTAAAGIILILGISGWFGARIYNQSNKYIDYQAIVAKSVVGNDIKLIMSDNSQKTFSGKEVDLKYEQNGQLVSVSDKHLQTETNDVSSDSEQMNQLIVPRGKRSSIKLSDGTMLWLNSGSSAIYPVTFNRKIREIYIEGEGYLEVVHDALKPFFVVTDQVRVKVLGTKFNVTAYKDDDDVSVVLVEGSVSATTKSDNILLKPSQVLNYSKLTSRSTIKETNVLESIAWKDGWMLCNHEKMLSIFNKLSRYYDVRIDWEGEALGNTTLTGKLDLKSSCEDVLKVICVTAPVKYEINGNKIHLSLKE